MNLIRKFRILAFLCLLTPTIAEAKDFYIDAPLCAAVIEQTNILEKEYKKRNTLNAAIQVAQDGIAGGLAAIHNVEDKMLTYLSNASDVMQNLSQIKKIIELAGELPVNLIQLGNDVPQNIKGTIVSAFVTKKIPEVITECASLVTLVEKLVTSKYSFKNNDDPNNINLLSSYERFAILNEVETRLWNINHKIKMFDLYIHSLGWRELWMGFDRESYIKLLSGTYYAKDIIKSWNKLSN